MSKKDGIEEAAILGRKHAEIFLQTKRLMDIVNDKKVIEDLKKDSKKHQ